MSKGLINDSTLTAIADAIRSKTETTDTMLPSEMAALIESISGGITPTSEILGIEIARFRGQSSIPTNFSSTDKLGFIMWTTYDPGYMSGRIIYAGQIPYSGSTNETAGSYQPKKTSSFEGTGNGTTGNINLVIDDATIGFSNGQLKIYYTQMNTCNYNIIVWRYA